MVLKYSKLSHRQIGELFKLLVFKIDSPSSGKDGWCVPEYEGIALHHGSEIDRGIPRGEYVRSI